MKDTAPDIVLRRLAALAATSVTDQPVRDVRNAALAGPGCAQTGEILAMLGSPDLF